jgi:hypothetical protein
MRHNAKAVIREEVKARFEAFLVKYRHAFPHYIATRYSKKPNYFVSLLQIGIFTVGGVLVALATLFQTKRQLNFFEGGRFVELHALLPADSVVIIGGLREWRYCKQHGYRFHWDGYIRKLFNIFYFLKLNIAMSILIFLIQNLIGRRLGANGRLFVFEDTVQIGVSLSLILKDITPVVCIAHGTISRAGANFDLVADGGVCAFNFVYDEHQAKVLENLGSTCFIMGLPYEIPKLSGWVEQIILIEQSTPDMPEEYDVCLPIMVTLYQLLKQAGHDVTYRARPGVDVSTLLDKFDSIHAGDKMQLLAGRRKVFVGYNSTLLYEAKVCGHVTVGLDDSMFPFMRRYSTDFVLSEITGTSVNASIGEALIKLRGEPSVSNEPLKNRFYACLENLEKSASLSIHSDRADVAVAK